MNYSVDPLQPILGYVLAATSSGVMWLAETVPAHAPWLQVGGTAGLIGGLSYGCITLWKSLQEQRREFTSERAAFIKAKEELEKEIRNDWKGQNDKLISVLQKIDDKN
jgi:hypothetical protein